MRNFARSARSVIESLGQLLNHRNKAFSGVCDSVCLCVCVCLHAKTKRLKLEITKLGSGIVHQDSSSPII